MLVMFKLFKSLKLLKVEIYILQIYAIQSLNRRKAQFLNRQVTKLKSFNKTKGFQTHSCQFLNLLIHQSMRIFQYDRLRLQYIQLFLKLSLQFNISQVGMATPYKSILQRIILPKKKRLQNDYKIFKPISESLQEDSYELSKPLLIKTNDLIEELNNTLQVYENASNFRFTFPESMFPPVAPGQRNNIRYEQKMVTEQENTFKNKLSEEQLKDIEETGQFKVKSNIQYITLPYVWRINPNLFWGKKKIREVWAQSLAAIFGCFWTAKQFMLERIPQELSKLASYPKQFLTVFLGLKSIKTVIPVDYQREIFKDFWHSILNEYYRESEQWGSALWNYLYVYNNPELSRHLDYSKSKQQRRKLQNERNKLKDQFYAADAASNQKKKQILQVHNQFQKQWGKLKKKLIIQITEEVSALNLSADHRAESQEQLLMAQESESNSTDDKIIQKLAQKKLTLYVEHIKTELPKKSVPIEVINAIIFILRLFNVIQFRINKHWKLQQKKRIETMNKIRQQYRIKSLFQPFFNYVLQKQMQGINKTLDEELYYSILKDKDIVSLVRKDQVQAIKQYIKLRFGHDALIQAKKRSLPQYHGPTRVFYSNYHLLLPYKVIKDESSGYYSLKKISDDLTVDTSTNFWKLRLYWMRFKTWTINCLVFLAYSAWKGPVGLRCLWGTQDFNYQMNINYQTGEIYYETRSTVIGTFNRVLDGIELSRRNFQQTPDLGLLGKNISRIGNYVECYIFRFLFVGVILTLIGYPILIIVASSLTIILVVTFWAWIPLIMAVCYLFNILIKQFQIAQVIDYDFFSRTFPIIRLVLGVLRCILIILFAFLNLLLIAPFKAIFIFTYCLIQNIFRRGLDSILLFAFKRVGRTPSSDTSIAKKVSGPGMTKEFYMSINEDDVYVLVQGRMEIIYLRQFDRLIRQKINENDQQFRSTMGKILKPFSVNYSSSNSLLKNVQELSNSYSKQYNQYCNRYPGNPQNVRFTQEQIDNYFDNTVNIVRRFVDKHEIGGWIFEKYQLYEGMYDQLTRNIWIEIFGFGEEIFQPLEKLDSRFKLQDQYKQADGFNIEMKRGVGSVMRALEGEVKLIHEHKKLTPFKHSLLHRQLSIEQIDRIFEYQRLNSINNVQTNTNDIKTLFVPNLNIKDIITIGDQERIRRIKEERYIIDL